MRNQEAGESFDKYLTELKILEKTCDFGTLSDSLIRDRNVCWINCLSLRERLLKEPNLTLKSSVDLCRASELSKERNKSLGNTEMVSRINSRPSSQKPNRSTQQKLAKTCLYCWRQHEMVKGKCPAYGKTCNRGPRQELSPRMSKDQDLTMLKQRQGGSFREIVDTSSWPQQAHLLMNRMN